MLLIVLAAWVGLALASNSTTTKGWQFDDDSRSSWDILWSCLPTIIACTWTALHLDVPPRNKSLFRAGVRKFWNLMVSLLAPELTAWFAAQDLWLARSTTARCNAAQAIRDQQTKESTSMLLQRAHALEKVEEDAVLDPVNTQWTLAQAYCIIMDGVALQAVDEWTYIIEQKSVHHLVTAGVVRCSDFRDREVQDRAKADSLAKAVTVLQSLWTLINVVSRAAYDMPISPMELSASAYVACGLFTYAFWWHKPKDMSTPITINLPWTRDELPEELRAILDARPQNWVHLRAISPKDNFFSLPRITRNYLRRVFKEEHSQAPLGDQVINPTLREEMALDLFAIVSAFVFCGIHVAAWNFAFPTRAERIAWRVFALTGPVTALSTYLLGNMPLLVRLLAEKFAMPPALVKWADPTRPFSQLNVAITAATYLLYAISRFGILALMISSLRALPAGSYVSLSAVTSIPHI